MCTRIIPAHAGFTTPRMRPGAACTDHPRTRGVYYLSATLGEGGERIIPAHAGFTSRLRDRLEAAGGSSPHTRGLHPFPGGRLQGLRIIPAHAGFTDSQARPRSGWQDHPRTRGVYQTVRRIMPGVAGSSPHTRGLPVPRGGDGPGLRIIPAHAGFTRAAGAPGAGRRDHPRTRGVYRPVCRWVTWCAGSSPHTRGLLQVYGNSMVNKGIIPAHAGFTSHWG